MAHWTDQNIPDQTGKTFVITGASSGIGEAAAIALAAKGAEVVLAVRDARKGDATRARILQKTPGADVKISLIDMASLASIRAFAERAGGEFAKIDVLLNNAGLGLQSARAVTEDGFERQFGTNHLGHFALTGLLMPTLLRAPAPRVVAIASIAHRRGTIDFDDLQGEKLYDGRKAYGQSKLANLMFAYELDRRARAEGSRLVSAAAHPGVAVSGFVTATGMPGPAVMIGNLGIALLGNSTARGAWPGLYAATMPDVQGGQYWGPDGFLEIRGNPAPAKPKPHALDQAVWQRLWTVSEELTGVTYPPLGA
jgi:NAD(P)-dependent dehydrogenase (short-subunit alcohol dehydrogenase family)